MHPNDSFFKQLLFPCSQSLLKPLKSTRIFDQVEKLTLSLVSLNLSFTVLLLNTYFVFSGCPHHLHDPVDYDCQMVKTLKSWGGVPFCLTNVPQTMFSLQCRLEDISPPDFSTTSFNPELSTPDFSTMNCSTPGVEKSGVDMS